MLGGRYARDEEIYFLGALLKWCMGDKDSESWESDAKLIVERKCKLTGRFTFSIYWTLRDQSHPLTKEVATTLKIPNHETFFGRQAREFHVECSNTMMLRYTARSYPDM